MEVYLIAFGLIGAGLIGGFFIVIVLMQESKPKGSLVLRNAVKPLLMKYNANDLPVTQWLKSKTLPIGTKVAEEIAKQQKAINEMTRAQIEAEKLEAERQSAEANSIWISMIEEAANELAFNRLEYDKQILHDARRKGVTVEEYVAIKAEKWRNKVNMQYMKIMQVLGAMSLEQIGRINYLKAEKELELEFREKVSKLDLKELKEEAEIRVNASYSFKELGKQRLIDILRKMQDEKRAKMEGSTNNDVKRACGKDIETLERQIKEIRAGLFSNSKRQNTRRGN